MLQDSVIEQMWGDGRVRKNSQVLAGATSPVHAEARRGSQTEAAEQELCVERRKGKWNHWSEAQSSWEIHTECQCQATGEIQGCRKSLGSHTTDKECVLQNQDGNVGLENVSKINNNVCEPKEV